MMNKIQKTIKNNNMIKKGDTIAVCLSGGADSMALFHFLCLEKEKLGINVLAIHINHGLREVSEQEEIFVNDYCEKMSIECITHRACMNDKQKPQGFSTESWARQIRYDFFEQVSKERNCILATAHTLSDNCETVIFNMARGSNIKGLKGISPVRDNIIRPLIEVTRNEVEQYCQDNNVPYVTDATNFQDIYSRNKIRLKVIPVLKEINSNFENNISVFTQDMNELNTFLTKLSDNLYTTSYNGKGFEIPKILEQDKVIIKHFLSCILREKDVLSVDNVQTIYKNLHKKEYSKQLSSNLFCYINRDILYFEDIKSKNKYQEIEIELDKNIEICGKIVNLRVFDKKDFKNLKKIDKNSLNYYVNCDKINSALFVRTRKTNDKITLLNRKVTKSLKKLFIEDKIPQVEKDKILVIATNENLVCVEGYGVNAEYALDEKQEKILVIQIFN